MICAYTEFSRDRPKGPLDVDEVCDMLWRRMKLKQGRDCGEDRAGSRQRGTKKASQVSVSKHLKVEGMSPVSLSGSAVPDRRGRNAKALSSDPAWNT